MSMKGVIGKKVHVPVDGNESDEYYGTDYGSDNDDPPSEMSNDKYFDDGINDIEPMSDNKLNIPGDNNEFKEMYDKALETGERLYNIDGYNRLTLDLLTVARNLEHQNNGTVLTQDQIITNVFGGEDSLTQYSILNIDSLENLHHLFENEFLNNQEEMQYIELLRQVIDIQYSLLQNNDF